VYCAIVYLRIVSVDDVSVKFLCAKKTRVTPLKTLTIPRLELLGCLLLTTTLLNECRIALKEKINIDQTFCWSDSEVALFWIKGKEKTWKLWVENRVVKIRKVVDRDNWFHVPRKLNPTDGPARMCQDFNEFFTEEWFKRPIFLKGFLTEKFLFNSNDTLNLVYTFAESRTKVSFDTKHSDTIVASCT